MIDTKFVEDMRKQLDMLEMYQHELEMAKEEGDIEDMEYFSKAVQQEKMEIANMLLAQKRCEEMGLG